MEWWYKISFGALILASFFILRYFFNRWRILVLEEERALYNQRLDNLTEVVTRLDMSMGNRRGSANIITLREAPPPDFEVAVKQSSPISYIDLDSPPPSYEESSKHLTTDYHHVEQIDNGIGPSSVQSQPHQTQINVGQHLTNHI